MHGHGAEADRILQGSTAEEAEMAWGTGEAPLKAEE